VVSIGLNFQAFFSKILNTSPPSTISLAQLGHRGSSSLVNHGDLVSSVALTLTTYLLTTHKHVVSE